tara:strand:+ start:221 stop:787 length:567 start_codon:yes stop_codon:yes gene_type:complete
MEQQRTSHKKLLCNKNDVNLYKLKDEYEYELNFTIRNLDYNIKQILGKDIYFLISDLNKDLIEEIKTLRVYDNSSKDLELSFKSFGKELGIRKKVMYINVVTNETNNTINYISEDIGKLIKTKNDYDIIYNKYSELNIEFITNHEAKFCYKFNIDIKEDLPIFMQNMIGVVMKKLYLNLKTFIEKMKT